MLNSIFLQPCLYVKQSLFDASCVVNVPVHLLYHLIKQLAQVSYAQFNTDDLSTIECFCLDVEVEERHYFTV